ncbi:FKBP-type peptidyl-prolyl cis-trans isomerase FklB [hydrothermal vent metagenome]|uniref:peptidylprolyl isomerase n=1 Tax=hydrothermal vent metagenome TaxID=652676 RepID=A0A3B0X0Y2_9ZZZZ
MLKAIPTAVICIGLTTLLTACNEKTGATAEKNIKLDSDASKASYSIGVQFGTQIEKVKDMIDKDVIIRGFQDSFAGKELKLTPEEMKTTMMAFQTTMKEKQKVKMEEMAKAGKAKGDKYLADNKAKEGVKTTASGLQYKILKAGDGATPAATDTVITHYTGSLIDGKVFDSSYKRNAPATFPVNGVIKGWTEALQLMKVGAKWQLFIPAELAYGDRGAGASIGPNQVLIFELELIEIKKVAAAATKPKEEDSAKKS